MILRFKYLYLFLFVGLGFISCSKKLVGEIPVKLERKKTEDLVLKIDSLSKRVPTTFYSKVSTKYADTNQNVAFKTAITILKDSTFSALVTYAGIPLVNALINKDSLQYINKKDKCFTKTTLAHLKEQFGVSFDFQNIQQLFLGLPLNYQSNLKYYQIHNPYEYIVSNYKKREIRKLERKDWDDFIIKYYLNADLKTLKKLTIENPKDNTSIIVNYLKYQFEKEYSIPSEVSIDIRTNKNHIEVHLEYDKLEINEPQDVFFTIPENYEVCN